VVADVAVVGAGIVGACAAYFLARAGVSVEVVDAGLAGQATAAATGIISPGTVGLRDPSVPGEILPLAFQAGAFYSRLRAWLAEDGEPDCGYAQVGSLVVARDEGQATELPALARALEARRRAGVPLIGQLEVLDGHEAHTAVPVLAPDAVGAIFIPDAARVDGRRLLGAVKRAASRRGATFRHGVGRLAADPSGGEPVWTIDGRPSSAGRVLLATGAWWSGHRVPPAWHRRSRRCEAKWSMCVSTARIRRAGPRSGASTTRAT
jgi:D-amino-acid dehydrogenase